MNHGFTLEVLTLYIPGLVETEEHVNIARLIADADSKTPTTLLAFFPCYNLQSPEYRSPTVQEMAESYAAMREVGLENLRLGNKGVFLRSTEDQQYLADSIGPEVV